jgi:hypothetical protein
MNAREWDLDQTIVQMLEGRRVGGDRSLLVDIDIRPTPIYQEPKQKGTAKKFTHDQCLARGYENRLFFPSEEFFNEFFFSMGSSLFSTIPAFTCVSRILFGVLFGLPFLFGYPISEAFNRTQDS